MCKDYSDLSNYAQNTATKNSAKVDSTNISLPGFGIGRSNKVLDRIDVDLNYQIPISSGHPGYASSPVNLKMKVSHYFKDKDDKRDLSPKTKSRNPAVPIAVIKSNLEEYDEKSEHFSS